MSTLKFKCELCSDVILNQNAASKGPNKTLDYIPGNCFLGIVAAQLYNEYEPEDQLKLFHTGEVRFGDAHPGIADDRVALRALRIPACLYYPKVSGIEGGMFVSPYTNFDDEQVHALQPKQCREGFYVMKGDKAIPVGTLEGVALKSAHDSERRTSSKGQMYVYESLSKGQEFYFKVDCDERWEDPIQKALIGMHRIGRSRSSEYGLVKISSVNYEDPATVQSQRKGEILVYADSRLIFLDEAGRPKFQPTAKELGFEEGKIDWSRSQVRTFSYAPYNYKRRTFDCDRQGIEKGSVFVVTGVEGDVPARAVVGYYKAEGFGEVIINPAFLQCYPNGKSKLVLKKRESNPPSFPNCPNTPLAFYVKNAESEHKNLLKIYTKVNTWCEVNKSRFRKDKERFSSQWGTIRSIATRCENEDEVLTSVMEYIGHGIASSRWSDNDRKDKLAEFIRVCEEEGLNVKEAVVNLAAQMAKICNDNKADGNA